MCTLSLVSITGCIYKALNGDGYLANTEGNTIPKGHFFNIPSVKECKRLCSLNDSCKSFTYCIDMKNVVNWSYNCHLKDLNLAGNEKTNDNGGCTSYFKRCSSKDSIQWEI
jgi:hypothetical protein